MPTTVSDDAVAQMPTPSIVIDATVARHNLERLAEYAKRHGLGIRPHTKTHKSVMIGRMQMEYGAVGLTVAKVGEAKVMTDAADDLLMAYPAVDPLRCADLAQLARGHTRWPSTPAPPAARSASWSTSTSACTAPGCRRPMTRWPLLNTFLSNRACGSTGSCSTPAISKMTPRTRSARSP